MKRHIVRAGITAAAISGLSGGCQIKPQPQNLQSAAAVRTGYLLLQRTAPDLADGYARYYLRSANASASATDPGATLASVFPLPDPLREAIVRQLDVVLGGI